ncbi:aromatic acid/H+ symporter, MFS-type [Variovorax paradoxus B4]|uniref:Aromatic acid/H+ symporter, MFS-type n=1 Tax=Variovorax paradoxus B4 TaxID=1246301 RepID=T1XJK6_VARPD|nr:MFS transporter [Variovorax paradoxus]AGU52758.1 aromatic acid/H+ symporter, MFS-type [Variovorax paradoxus B4]
MTQDLRKTFDEGPMSRFQWSAITICIALIMLDGFDVLVMAFTAASVSAEWKLSGAQLGVLFSAGLFGMAAGSLFLAPLADRFGRQTVILLCLVVIALGMGLSALARSSTQLAALRALTGLGIGGMLASVGVITSEYASNKWRSTAVALQATGYPIGATIGGSIAAVLLESYGWRSVFLFGGIATALMIPLVLWRLPESVDFLVSRRPASALRKLNALLRQMKRPELAELPPLPPAGARSAATVASLFSASLARSTLLLWAAFFLLMFSFYFALSWTPKLLVSAGLSAREGITGGVLLNIGGIVGGSLFGLLVARLNLGRLTAASLTITALAMAVFGAATGHLGASFAIAFLIGGFIFGSMAGLYAFAPVIYPAAVRTTGMGWAIGIGRIGAILAPLIAGMLLDGGWQPPHLYYAYALPPIAATAAVLALRRSAAAQPAGRVISAH